MTAIELHTFTGPKAFGRAYGVMLDNDPHAEGSVVRAIMSGMIRLCSKTVAYLYEDFTDLATGYVEGSRPVLQALLAQAELPIGDQERQVAVNLFNLNAAYSGHVIVEVHRLGTWGAVDTNSGFVYRKDDGRPATTWDLMNDAELVMRYGGSEGAQMRPSQFASAGIANYKVRDSDTYDYTVTGLNEYYRAILTMAKKGWPGGLRWLHGEAD